MYETYVFTPYSFYRIYLGPHSCSFCGRLSLDILLEASSFHIIEYYLKGKLNGRHRHDEIFMPQILRNHSPFLSKYRIS